MPEWLIPLSIFWALAALYLGGAAVRIEGGTGARQVLGLLLLFVLYAVVWTVLHAALGGFAAPALAVVLATVLALLALPLEARIAFRLVGVRIRRGTGGHAHG